MNEITVNALQTRFSTLDGFSYHSDFNVRGHVPESDDKAVVYWLPATYAFSATARSAEALWNQPPRLPRVLMLTQAADGMLSLWHLDSEYRITPLALRFCNPTSKSMRDKPPIWVSIDE